MWIGGTGIMAVLMIVVAVVWLHGRAPVRTRPTWTDQARQATLAEHTGIDRPNQDVDSDEAALQAYNAWLARLAEKP